MKVRSHCTQDTLPSPFWQHRLQEGATILTVSSIRSMSWRSVQASSYSRKNVMDILDSSFLTSRYGNIYSRNVVHCMGLTQAIFVLLKRV